MYQYAVGEGCTKCVGGDQYGGTVIAVSPSGKTITWQVDRVSRVNGEIVFTPFSSGETVQARWNPRREAFMSGYAFFHPGRTEYRVPER